MRDKRSEVSLRQIEVFVRVFEAGSFSRAARALGLSQPTVSAHLKALEAELGVSLFARRGRVVRPTVSAEKLHAQAQRLLQLKDEVLASVFASGGELRGELVIGASNIPASYLLPKRLLRYGQLHPAVRVLLQTGDSRTVLEMVHRGDVTLGFVGIEPVGRRYESRPLGRDRLVLVAHAGHALAGRRITPQQLRGHRLIVREPGSGTRRAAETALAELGVNMNDDLEIVLEVGSNEAARQAVAAGIGISLVSDLSVKDELKHGTLRRITVRGLSLDREFYCVSSRGRPLASAAQALLAVL
jgi:DNA-binding transcriptional LysR family regulator